MSKVVLITGCSTGIGRDLAVQLAQSGYTVVATARKAETMDDLKVAQKLPLDVTGRNSIPLRLIRPSSALVGLMSWSIMPVIPRLAL